MQFYTKFSSWIYPVTLLSFTGTAVTFLSPYFNTTTRWGLMFFILIFMFSEYRLKGLLDNTFSKILLINAIWAMLTILWSEVPLLSAMKSTIFLIVAFCFTYAGQRWVTANKVENSMDIFWLLGIISLLAASLGLTSETAVVMSGNSALYQGLVGGPNMMGSMLAMSTPWIVWKIYTNWRSIGHRLFWITLLLICIYFLLMANSRAAMIASFLCLISLTYSLGHRRWVPIATTAVFIVIATMLIMPVVYETVVTKYVYKNASEEQGVLYTRANIWEQSLYLAKQGGIIGGGYGVTIGDDSFEGGFTAIGYGREKGNTQLAIMEETGLVGLGLYAMLLWSLFSMLVTTFFRCKSQHLRVCLGITIGSIAGMVFQSIFEAWWVAPGSPESVFFWTLVGVSIGICRVINVFNKKIEHVMRSKEALKNQVPVLK